MRKKRMALAVAMAFPILAGAQNAPTKSLGVVTITEGQPTSLPTQIPTTMESVTRQDIEQKINATDSEDALKYLPSLLVRKRYIGDYNHAILSSRASGTGNSARSLVYGDGILLSNLLGNGVGGLSFPPRWGLVTPEEIERVDVMYGPFSAAYPGNSVGAVVDYVTRMPTQFEAHGKVGFQVQPFELYNTDQTFRSWEASTSVGNRNGDWSWFLNFNHTDSESQPLTFATRLVSQGTPGTAGTPVTGAVVERNNANLPEFILGTQTQYHTKQDHAKVKVAYDFSPTVRAAYTLGFWQNDSFGDSASYLRGPTGNTVTSGAINIGGTQFPALTGADFPLTQESLTHWMHGLSIKSHTQGVFDWELAASLYDYSKDIKRQNAASNPIPAARDGGAGTIADGSGTGWNTLAARGTWRPFGQNGPHIFEGGLQQDSFKLDYLTSNASDWLNGVPTTPVSDVAGKTRLRSAWAQDAWSFAPAWKTVLGGRYERWDAYDGLTFIAGTPTATNLTPPPLLNTPQATRSESHFSPKAAVSWQWRPDTVIKASVGRAVRMPTVQELYGATSTTNSLFINDPNLRPEKSWTTELSLEKDLGNALVRATLFTENTHDAIYSQLLPVIGTNGNLINVSRVQNVDRIATQGLEFAANAADVWLHGLELQGSLTYAHSIIKENAGFVVTPGDTIGKRQPNIPLWRATALANYHWSQQLSTSIAARYSGKQFRTLNNSDVNGFTYQGVSKFFTVDLRAVYQATKATSVAFGIDNVNNYQYWNFHPYPQRTYVAEMKVDL
ncbi:TonB-dependent receptor [Ramlibacter sp.]|uniref:TonB-dependent receptor n=1 Tax=Ramlibacter sp. TaxID=1917967 RepID=UPI00262369C7|nr:TonB-dependent receptor [Ramlibacter sp.]MDB5956769.1 TonB-dependent receptor [Ramlibacter sp.]